ncbi:MAG: alpha/beta hydrolase [Cyanomargarita calcarea GSE-NOS-MK-12-04C]|jgi:hypothetical protein|uniref:Alpha/beta hydrolase n=1 Tax=Cyanomargarita calcarea GSE-NOS-MK-12-04C TaxID=2839659 RepID=A0A951QUQ6_9CYAN|nr:alpha/beta hydrolase [Cyanomargarita calcarea GSE-NOS-MK-12-04C]
MIRKKLLLSIQFLYKLLPWLGVAAAIAYIGVCIFLYVGQPHFIFSPTTVIEKTPAYFNQTYEEVWLPVKSVSGKVTRMHGWWIPKSNPENKVLLYLHGNGENIGANTGHAVRLQQLGFSVLLIDYRGYGRSGGDFPNEARVYQDAGIAWDYLVQERRFSPQQIYIYGHSLGGAIAIDLAVKHPNAAGLIVESSFTSIRQVVDYNNKFWMFPVDLLLTQRFESIKKVPNLKMPVLFIHGTADSTVPAFMSQKLYQATKEPKALLLVKGSGHNNTALFATAQYIQAVRSFLQQVYRQ